MKELLHIPTGNIVKFQKVYCIKMLTTGCLHTTVKWIGLELAAVDRDTTCKNLVFSVMEGHMSDRFYDKNLIQRPFSINEFEIIDV